MNQNVLKIASSGLKISPKCVCGRGSAPYPTEGAYSGGRRNGNGGRKGGEGKGGEGMGEEGEGEGV